MPCGAKPTSSLFAMSEPISGTVLPTSRKGVAFWGRSSGRPARFGCLARGGPSQQQCRLAHGRLVGASPHMRALSLFTTPELSSAMCSPPGLGAFEMNPASSVRVELLNTPGMVPAMSILLALTHEGSATGRQKSAFSEWSWPKHLPGSQDPKKPSARQMPGCT